MPARHCLLMLLLFPMISDVVYFVKKIHFSAVTFPFNCIFFFNQVMKKTGGLYPAPLRIIDVSKTEQRLRGHAADIKSVCFKTFALQN